MATTEITLALLIAAVGRAVAAAAIPNDWNGDIVQVDMAKPVDYTKAMGKIVSAAGVYNLRDNIEYHIWLIQGSPDANVVMTQEHIDLAIPVMRMIIARYAIYKLFIHAGIAVNFRGADVIANDYADGAVKQRRAAAELYTMLTADGEMTIKIAETGRNVLLSILANAIHRDQCERHSWFTGEMNKSKSPTGKTLLLAGKTIDSFKAYMTTWGHEGNHHIADVSIDLMAKVLSGTATPTNLAAGFNWNGTDVDGKELNALLHTGEATQGRYPPGVLGKAALIIGGGMINAMIIHLATKVKIGGTAELTANVDKFVNAMKTATLTHKAIVEINKTFDPIIALVYGFCLASKLISETEYLAFENHAKRNPTEIAAGKSLALSLKRAAPHKEALSGAVVTTLSKIAESLAATSATVIDPADPTAKLVKDPLVVDPKKITAEVGSIAGAGAQMFYDASEN